ncbi:alpha/beta fold hydrolase [Frankia sp. AgKG'84/4]|uniref:alpha/beta fold hydrolase n=1 Tax=Frankia sp. AgKG'84/4 TaxID=573490 RepID=UPI00202A5346|nr:alpha/beta hydrolase [Frankia sp. AgKG'84/4]MCL9793592.1 alpha/beta hydrolase [Frankia sp. AgKG'84/4]
MTESVDEAAGPETARSLDDLIEHRYATVNGVELHYVIGGQGPTVLLLHGFPDFWYTWRDQIPPLIAAGFRVVAPDLRGYNLSAKPAGVASYHVRELCADVDGLIRHLGETQVDLVGHDWGGFVAWFFTMRHPERVRHLAVLNMLHPERLFTGFRSPSQLRRSWYMFFFRLPRLPEKALTAGGEPRYLRVYETEPNTPFSPAELDRYREAFRDGRTLTAGINYYRALIGNLRTLRRRFVHRIDTPTLVLFGDGDPHLRSDLADPLPSLVPNARSVHYPQAGHWLQHDLPTEVTDQLVAFFRT